MQKVPSQQILPIYRTPGQTPFPALYHNGKTRVTDKRTSSRDGSCLLVEPASTPWHPRVKSLPQMFLQIFHLSVPGLFKTLFITTTMSDEQLCEIILK